MVIEEGKFYRTRDGRKFGPMERVSKGGTAEYPWRAPQGGAWMYHSSGRWGDGTHNKDFDLIAEWVDELPTGFSHDRWNTLVDETFAEMKKLAQMKGGEYSGDTDRLLNFRRNGANLGLPMETVWAVYAGKHWDAIQQFIKDQREGVARERLEPIEGRVDDLLVYLLLLKAMLIERDGA